MTAPPTARPDAIASAADASLHRPTGSHARWRRVWLSWAAFVVLVVASPGLADAVGEEADPSAQATSDADAAAEAGAAEAPEETGADPSPTGDAVGSGDDPEVAPTEAGSDGELVDPETGDAPAPEAEPVATPSRPLPSYESVTEGTLAWRKRVEALELARVTGQGDSAEANRLFGELSGELWPMQASVHEAIHADAPDLITRHADLTALYGLRSRLFPLLSRQLRVRLTGLSEVGRSEAARELDYLSANVEYQQHILGKGLDQLRAGFEEAPLQALWGLFRIVLVVMVFRWWRRWADDGIPEMRRGLLDARLPGRRVPWRARVLWYVDRVRRPLEWLALVWIVSGILQPAGFEELSTLVRTVVKWLFIGAATVLLIDARAARTARRST
ncbi:MAG: hypothetical protein OEV20_05355, partial [Actinomycetota bacterium]|nr:hypothetical protein [Actinomycetota bacterium]